MKARLNIYTFVLLLLCITESTIGQECNYDSTDLNISLNGWDIDRTDYTHERFIEVAGLGHNSQLDYSGEKDTEEFGYPWYYYKLGNSFIHFSGILDNSGNFNGQKRIFLFKIKSRDVCLNVNGIKIGDTLSKLNQTFNDSNFCNITYEGQQAKMLRYEHFTLYFVISSDNVIKEIGLNKPL